MSFLHLAFRSVTSRHVASASLSRLHMNRFQQRAAFSAASALDKSQIEARVLDVLKTQAFRFFYGRFGPGQFGRSRSRDGRRGGRA